MLFFRSEESVGAWCRERGIPRRPILSLDQLWRRAVAWYDTRLTPGARRPQPATRSAGSSRESGSRGLSGIPNQTSSA